MRGCRTAYDGNFVAITASIGRPFASSRSSSRQRNACVSTLLARIPLVRHGDELRLVTVLAQRLHEPVREDLGAAALERHLRHADGEPHGRSRSSSSTRRESSSTSRSSASLTIRCSAKAGSTYQRIELAQHALDLERDPALRARPALERLVGADRPEPLGEAAHRRRVAGIAVDRPLQLLVDPVDVSRLVQLRLRHPARSLVSGCYELVWATATHW